uniref:HYR domain-containing protein n=1 Tax=Chromera velia CCMP2878 TaxID=1169474 RepID=A0A0G4I102_9ALVE|eukprot:Cvel_1641.t1-p1 / transcript=Cvel_1641.t1 / gene=Cvel_1641 / organism=Chromera_velia_CCMP2878 / gene_product=Fibrillin-1, putative / transcript_product=Fibrillin-1, putative / location=Cvel_scaffold59:4636-26874(-) / protein_length=2633 / sequence_SO=supercontig / SO=protein_coding / is_pseudo=false
MIPIRVFCPDCTVHFPDCLLVLYTELDECAAGVHNCDPQATCTNTNGSFTCACTSGTDGDGVVCGIRIPPSDIGMGHAQAFTWTKDVVNLYSGLPTIYKNYAGAVCPGEYRVYTSVPWDSHGGNVTTVAGDENAPSSLFDGSEEGLPWLTKRKFAGLDAAAESAVLIFLETPCYFTLKGYAWQANDCCETRNPSAMSVSGANSSAGPWTELHSYSGVSDWTTLELKTFASNTTSERFKFFAFTLRRASSGPNIFYTGDQAYFLATDWAELDECAAGVHNCDPKANCTNTNGSFTCSCGNGLDGDGLFCGIQIPQSDIGRGDSDSFTWTKDITRLFNGRETIYKDYGGPICPGQYRMYTPNAWAGQTGDASIIPTEWLPSSLFDASSSGRGWCTMNFQIEAFNSTSASDTEIILGTPCHMTVAGYSWQARADELSAPSEMTLSGANSTGGPWTLLHNFTGLVDWVGMQERRWSVALRGGPFNFHRFVLRRVQSPSSHFGCGLVAKFYAESWTEVDECAIGVHDCDVRANCSNTNGSFACTCIPAFEGNGTFCGDLNECLNTTDHNCDPAANCSNTHGSFLCACSAGWTGTGIVGGCSDFNECQASVHDCHAGALCSNTNGSFECHCNTGFNDTGVAAGMPNGTQCTNLNECAMGTDDCAVSAVCNDTWGSFACICGSGLFGPGTFCADSNECALNLHHCSSIAACTNTFGSFACACPLGYSSADSGVTCTDDDECISNVHNCDVHATCTNTDGSFFCSCDTGFGGNGIFCIQSLRVDCGASSAFERTVVNGVPPDVCLFEPSAQATVLRLNMPQPHLPFSATISRPSRAPGGSISRTRPLSRLQELRCNDGYLEAGSQTVTCSGVEGADPPEALWQQDSGTSGCEDVTPPSFDCPDYTTETDPSSSQAQIGSYSFVTITDPGGIASVVNDPTVPRAFPAGSSDVTITATDTEGNKGSCSFTISVRADDYTYWTAGKCMPCPADTSCQGNLFGKSKEVQPDGSLKRSQEATGAGESSRRLQAGYVGVTENVYEAGQHPRPKPDPGFALAQLFPTAVVVECPIGQTCEETVFIETDDGIAQPNVTCAEGMRGPVCSQCDVGFYRTTPDAVCQRCLHMTLQVTYAVLGFIAVQIMVIFYTSMNAVPSEDDEKTHIVAIRTLLNFLSLIGFIGMINIASLELPENIPKLDELIPGIPSINGVLSTDCILEPLLLAAGYPPDEAFIILKIGNTLKMLASAIFLTLLGSCIVFNASILSRFKRRRVEVKLQQQSANRLPAPSPEDPQSSSRRANLTLPPSSLLGEARAITPISSSSRGRGSSIVPLQEEEREVARIQEEHERNLEKRMRTAGLTEAQQRQLMRLEIWRRWNKRVLGIWRCEPLAEGLETRVESAPSVSCSDEVYIRWSGIAAASMVLLGVVIPLLLGVALVTELRRLRLESNRPLRANFRRRFGFLIQGFRAGFEFWELTIIIRKFLLQLCLAFYFGENSNMRLSQAVWLAVFSFVVQSRFRPFNTQDNDILNRLESEALAFWLLSLVLFQMILLESMTALQNLAVMGAILGLNGFFLVRISSIIVIGYIADVSAVVREVDESSDPSTVLPDAVVRVPFLWVMPILKWIIHPIEVAVDRLVSKDTLRLVDNHNEDTSAGVHEGGGALTEKSVAISSFVLARCGKVFGGVRPLSREELLGTLLEIDLVVSDILIKWDTEMASDRKKEASALNKKMQPPTSFRSLAAIKQRPSVGLDKRRKGGRQVPGGVREGGRAQSPLETHKKFQPPEHFDEFLFRWALVCSQRLAEDEELAASSEGVNDLDELLWIAQKLLRPSVEAKDDHPFLKDLQRSLESREKEIVIPTGAGEGPQREGSEKEEDSEEEDECSPMVSPRRRTTTSPRPAASPSLPVVPTREDAFGLESALPPQSPSPGVILSKRRAAFDIAGDRWDPLSRDELAVEALTWADRKVRSGPDSSFHLMTPKSFRLAVDESVRRLPSPVSKKGRETGSVSEASPLSPSPASGKRFRSFRLPPSTRGEVTKIKGMKPNSKRQNKGLRRGIVGGSGAGRVSDVSDRSLSPSISGSVKGSVSFGGMGRNAERLFDCVVPERLRQSGFPLRPSQLQKVGEAFFSFGQNGHLLESAADLDTVLRALRTFLHMHPVVVLWHYLCFMGAKRRILDRGGMSLIARWLRYIRTDVAHPACNPPMTGFPGDCLSPLSRLTSNKSKSRGSEGSESLGSQLSDLRVQVWKSTIRTSLAVARVQAKQRGERPNYRLVERVHAPSRRGPSSSVMRSQSDRVGRGEIESGGEGTIDEPGKEDLFCDFAFVELPLSDHFGVTHPSGGPAFEVDSVHGKALECWLPLAEGPQLREGGPGAFQFGSILEDVLGESEEEELEEEPEEEGEGGNGNGRGQADVGEVKSDASKSSFEERSPLLMQQNLPPPFFSTGISVEGEFEYREKVKAGDKDAPLSAPKDPAHELDLVLRELSFDSDDADLLEQSPQADMHEEIRRMDGSGSRAHQRPSEVSQGSKRGANRNLNFTAPHGGEREKERGDGAGKAAANATLSAMQLYESVALGTRSRLPTFRSHFDGSSRPFGLKEETERVKKGLGDKTFQDENERREEDREEESDSESDVSEVTPLKRRSGSPIQRK